MSQSDENSAGKSGVLRIIDVNANRAAEGLRVVEEYLRFELQDSLLTAHCKDIRHKLSKTVEGLVDRHDRVCCRSTETDVGTCISADGEYERVTVRDVVAANINRVTESLRVLEEYGKLLSSDAAMCFERLRYKAYTLEKSLIPRCRARRLLDGAVLYVLVDEAFGFETEFWDRIGELLEADVDVIQLRAKKTPDRMLVPVARALSARCREFAKLFVVNDRPDIARIANADGLHVGQDEITVADARAVVGPDVIIGVSTHSLEQAHEAVRDGADYIGVGPVFPSETKHFDEQVGVDLVGQVSRQIDLPFFAIGGIDELRLPNLWQVGVRRIAVSHAIWHTSDPANTARRFKEILRQ